ncbi:hypothetical protein [Streptomyces violaceus]|uniref:DUF7848 domain-containing protein n=1 Tax=Streptomyces violaceus TaxID=1936 RepID=A0ABZ1NNH5_STRVL
MSDSVYPEVAASIHLKALPTRDLLVCMHCTEGPRLDEETDPVKWAREHTKRRPWHNRYRVEHLTNFSVPVEEPAEHPETTP